jgi:hypothetical protein
VGGRNRGHLIVGATCAKMRPRPLNLTVALGLARYSTARHLVITADGGGSNGSRVRLWKLMLQALADELGLTITVCHLPPGTSKWNKIVHRLFSFVTQIWRGRPLVTHQVIVELIAANKTKAGLTARSEIDPNLSPARVKVTDQKMATINIRRRDFHGECNYTIALRPKQ